MGSGFAGQFTAERPKTLGVSSVGKKYLTYILPQLAPD
jgi:hypothetical protein